MTKMNTGSKKPMHGSQNAVKVVAAGGKAQSKPTPRATMGKQSGPAYGAQATIKVKAAKKK